MKVLHLAIFASIFTLAFPASAVATANVKPVQPARTYQAVKSKSMVKARNRGAGFTNRHANTKTGLLGPIDQALIARVFEEICMNEIREPQVAMRQAILETGWLRSPYLMRRNNLFGFKKINYLSFSNWRASVAFYREWQIKNPQLAGESYERFLIRIKYGSAGYVAALNTIQWDRPCPVQVEDHMKETLLEN